MCISCDTYGADHDGPTEPGIRSTPRVRRQFDRSFDAVVFDLPVLPVTYVGVRKSVIKAKQRELADALDYAILWGCVAACMALAVLTYILDF
jgi:hypothetical protein